MPPTTTTAPNPSELLAGLRKALSGKCLLKGTNPEAMFPGGIKGTRLIQAARDLNYLVVLTETSRIGRRTVRSEFGLLTEKGREFVLRADDPKPILESLLVGVNRLMTSGNDQRNEVEQRIAEARELCKKAVEDSSAACHAKIEKAYQEHSQTASKALSQFEATLKSTVASLPSNSIDVSGISTAIGTALSRLNEPGQGPHPVSPTTSSGTDPFEIQTEIIAFVDQRYRDKSIGISFDELWKHLRTRFASLKIGEFHDALRQLSPTPIRLSGWGRVHDEMPTPELALFISTKVMYYAHPAHANE